MYTVLNWAKVIERPVASGIGKSVFFLQIPTMVLFNISFLHLGPVVPTWTLLLGATNCFLQNNFNLHTYSQSCCLYFFNFSLHYQMRSLLAIALKFCYNKKKKKRAFFALNWSPAPFSLDNEKHNQLCKSNNQSNHFFKKFNIVVVKHLISICKILFHSSLFACKLYDQF